MSPDERISDTEAAKRVRFDLSYKRSRSRRRLSASGIDGPEIPNSYHWSRKITGDEPDDLSWKDAPGDWCHEVGSWDNEHQAHVATFDEWVTGWFTAAIGEATHEAMEWLWLDGRPVIDPHGPQENAIHTLSARFAADLLALGAGVSTTGPADSEATDG